MSNDGDTFQNGLERFLAGCAAALVTTVAVFCWLVGRH